MPPWQTKFGEQKIARRCLSVEQRKSPVDNTCQTGFLVPDSAESVFVFEPCPLDADGLLTDDGRWQSREPEYLVQADRPALGKRFRPPHEVAVKWRERLEVAAEKRGRDRDRLGPTAPEFQPVAWHFVLFTQLPVTRQHVALGDLAIRAVPLVRERIHHEEDAREIALAVDPLDLGARVRDQHAQITREIDEGWPRPTRT